MSKVAIKKSIGELKLSYRMWLNGSGDDFDNIIDENPLSEKSKKILLQCLTELQRHSIAIDREVDYGVLAWLSEIEYDNKKQIKFYAEHFKNPSIDEENGMIIFEP